MRLREALPVLVMCVAASTLGARAAAPAPPPAPASTPEPASEKGATFETAGVTIWYEVRGGGTGTPLVLVNGGPGFDHAYLTVSDAWDRLSKERRIVFYDQRGNGRSSPLKEGQA